MSFSYLGCVHGYPLKGSLASMYFGMGECQHCDESGVPYYHPLRGVNKVKNHIMMEKIKSHYENPENGK